MHKACPLSEPAPGEALRLDSAVRRHEVQIVDSNILVIESGEAPNLRSGPTPQGHV